MANFKRINERLSESNDGTFRIELGPRMLKGVATAELLSDKVTAAHYQAGRLDAKGKPIVLGQDMDYADWLGPHVHNLYRLVDDRYELIGQFETEAQAEAAAI
jgi:hypothetical protein